MSRYMVLVLLMFLPCLDFTNNLNAQTDTIVAFICETDVKRDGPRGTAWVLDANVIAARGPVCGCFHVRRGDPDQVLPNV